MLIPTRRLLFIALIGLIPIALAGSHRLALLIAFAWLAGVVGLSVIDGWFGRPDDGVTWVRGHDTKLSIGAWNQVQLTVTNSSHHAITFRVRDAVPWRLLPHGESSSGECAAGGSWTLTYRVFPIHRGDYAFGPAGTEYLGPLGLVWGRHTAMGPDDIKVYPNLLAIRSYEALVRRGQLQEIGLRNSRRWGAGTEFERLRDYSPDDEYRRINWKATARRFKPMTVDYQTERSQNVHVILDAGRLMSTQVPVEGSSMTTPQPLTRLDYSLNASVLLAYVSYQYGDRVGLLAFSDRVLRYLTPAPGKRQFLRLTEALYNLEAERTEADYDEGLGYLAVRNPRRSLLVIFTDIADAASAASLVANVGYLSRRHLALVVTVRDPGVERMANKLPADAADVYRRAVARTLLEDRERTLSQLRGRGVLTLDAPADKLSPSLINRYLEIKARSRL